MILLLILGCLIRNEVNGIENICLKNKEWNLFWDIDSHMNMTCHTEKEKSYMLVTHWNLNGVTRAPMTSGSRIIDSVSMIKLPEHFNLKNFSGVWYYYCSIIVRGDKGDLIPCTRKINIIRSTYSDEVSNIIEMDNVNKYIYGMNTSLFKLKNGDFFQVGIKSEHHVEFLSRSFSVKVYNVANPFYSAVTIMGVSHVIFFIFLPTERFYRKEIFISHMYEAYFDNEMYLFNCRFIRNTTFTNYKSDVIKLFKNDDGLYGMCLFKDNTYVDYSIIQLYRRKGINISMMRSLKENNSSDTQDHVKLILISVIMVMMISSVIAVIIYKFNNRIREPRSPTLYEDCDIHFRPDGSKKRTNPAYELNRKRVSKNKTSYTRVKY